MTRTPEQIYKEILACLGDARRQHELWAEMAEAVDGPPWVSLAMNLLSDRYRSEALAKEQWRRESKSRRPGTT
jgi:hypothetical protein